MEAYKTGRGHLTLRAKTHFEDIGKNRQAIIVTETPYQVNKARLISHAAGLVNDKKLEGVSDIRDESDRPACASSSSSSAAKSPRSS